MELIGLVVRGPYQLQYHMDRITDLTSVAKRDFINRLGCAGTVALGNGRNDPLMLHAAELGIAVNLREGAAAGTLAAADIVRNGILPALELLSHPLRLTATLRS